MAERATDTLVRFARIVSDAAASEEMMPRLCEALVEHVSADGIAVVVLEPSGGARLAAEHGLPEGARSVSFEPDDIGADLGRQILGAAEGAFACERTRPLVAGGGLFGAVVMLFRSAAGPPEESLLLAEGLVDLAAIALGSAIHVAQLEKQFTDLRTSQELLARTEKLRALGQMAAGVSHDLKNILNPLSLHLQIIQRALDKGKIDDVKESIPEMKQVLVRGLETLERLRDYSRQSKESKTELVELDVLAREAAKIAKPRMASSGGGRVVTIREELTGPPAVMAMSGEVVSALVNLVVNAIDALGGKGTITLRSGEHDGGSWVAVEDDGPGMPKEVEQKIFEPFFTTKGSEGTGLGLAMVYATMQRHGGTITLDTAPGEGTRIRLWFPPPSPASAGHRL
ncbi:MAG: GAF domain-containing sensor histidine kinase [Labilithrix sp.]|nr:GAF domain-containing sensor histidine kinase [Labilithrix sp.]